MQLDALFLPIPHSAGQVGASKGGLDFGNGTADVIQEIIALRLNVSLGRVEPLFI
jgi:hypothetical protein